MDDIPRLAKLSQDSHPVQLAAIVLEYCQREKLKGWGLVDFEDTEEYDPSYVRAIATLAQRLYESKLLQQINQDDLDRAWLWDSAVSLVPQLQAIAYQVNDCLDYELSYSQCCNAVNWIYQCNPEEWSHLLNSA